MNYLTFEVKEGREMYVVPVKSKVEILQNFLAFSEYMNFTFLFLSLLVWDYILIALSMWKHKSLKYRRDLTIAQQLRWKNECRTEDPYPKVQVPWVKMITDSWLW